jgi:hypothetical protein
VREDGRAREAQAGGGRGWAARAILCGVGRAVGVGAAVGVNVQRLGPLAERLERAPSGVIQSVTVLGRWMGEEGREGDTCHL